MRPPTFQFRGRTYEYFEHPYNNAAQNERTVEVPLGLAFLKQSPFAIEVGAVTCYYAERSHQIIDLHDPHPRAIHHDLRHFGYRGRDVLSISTIEHVDADAPSALRRIVEHANSFLVTWPLGYSLELDLMLEPFEKFIHFLSRLDQHNTWAEVRQPIHRTYGEPYPCGNTVAVLTNRLW